MIIKTVSDDFFDIVPPFSGTLANECLSKPFEPAENSRPSIGFNIPILGGGMALFIPGHE